MKNQPSIFLSHNAADKEFARQLAIDLDIAGARVWFDEAEIKVGDSLIEKIREGIDSVDYLAVVISPNSVRSSWVSKEVDIAMNQEIKGGKVKVLPILLKDCELPGFLEGKLYADFRKEENYNDSFLLIANRLGLSTPSIKQVESRKTIQHVLPDIYERPIHIAALLVVAIAIGTFYHSIRLSFLPDSIEYILSIFLFMIAYTLPAALSSIERFVNATAVLGILQYFRYEVPGFLEWGFIFNFVTGVVVCWAWVSLKFRARMAGSLIGFLAGASIAYSVQPFVQRIPDIFQSGWYNLLNTGIYVLLVWTGIIMGDLIVVNKSHTIETIYKAHRLEKR
ncbi:MAG: toll/interleukin-1 receptor domain-containing protein [Candidatus Thiodiazotropha taylori]|nr:toll/interleukin-1 receptor domain-containing protein [Candidatus Thiodiazotropha taylori]